MFFAIEIQTSGVYVSPHSQSLIALSESLIRDRKIALNDTAKTTAPRSTISARP